MNLTPKEIVTLRELVWKFDHNELGSFIDVIKGTPVGDDLLEVKKFVKDLQTMVNTSPTFRTLARVAVAVKDQTLGGEEK